MLKDLGFTLLSLLIVLFVFFLWNGFWRNYTLAQVFRSIGAETLALKRYQATLKLTPKGILEDREEQVRQEVLTWSTDSRITTSTAFVNCLILMSSDADSRFSRFREQSIGLLFKYGRFLSKQSESHSQTFEDFVQRLRVHNPSSSLSYFLEGENQFRLKQRRGAVTAFKEAFKRSPFFEKVILRLLQLYLPKKRWNHIIGVAKPHLREMSPSFFFYATLGKAYFFTRRYNEAIGPLRRAVSLKESAFQETFLLGRIGELLDRDDLIDFLKRAYQLDSDRLDLMVRWLSYHSEKGRHDKVLESYDEGGFPQREFQLLYMNSLIEGEDLERYQRFVKESSLKVEEHPQLLYFHGLLAFKKRNYLEAIPKLNAYLNQEKISFKRKQRALEILLEIAETQGNFQRQRYFLRQLLKFSPQSTPLYRKLGDSFVTEGRGKEALKAYLNALSFYPDDEPLLEKSCILLFKNRAYFKVIELLTALPFLPMRADLTFLLIRSYLKVFDYESARMILRRFLASQSVAQSIPKDLRFLLDDSRSSLEPPQNYESQLAVFQAQEQEFLRVLEKPIALSATLANELASKGQEAEVLRSDLAVLKESPASLKILKRACKSLAKNKAWFKVISILSAPENIFHDNELSFLLVRSYLRLFELKKAGVILQNFLLKHSTDIAIPDEFQFLLDPKFMASASASSQDLEERKKLAASELDFLKVVEEQSLRVSKHSLPPSANLFRRINLKGEVTRTYPYKGQAEVYIPDGRMVDLIDALDEAQQAYFEGRKQQEKFYLARYRGQLHRIEERYLEILDAPHGDYIGKARIANIDSNYRTLAQMETVFEPGRSLRIRASTLQGEDRTIVLGDDSYLSFLAVPLEAYSVQVQSRIFHYFKRDYMKILDGYDFLEGRAFKDVFAIPSESRLALFGPDLGGITVFQKAKDQSYSLVHETRLLEQIQRIERFQPFFSRIAYRGQLIVDANHDNILDYFSFWQSKTHKHKGLLHGLVSAGEKGALIDYLIPSDLRFLADYHRKARISVLNFFRDLDQDGRLEFLVFRPMAVKAGKENLVPWWEIYQIRGRRLENRSAYFPDFFKHLRLKLHEIRSQRERGVLGSGTLYSDWYAAYLKALRRLEQLKTSKI
jgi:tetratricopeptide (TPR) repeat protein